MTTEKVNMLRNPGVVLPPHTRASHDGRRHPCREVNTFRDLSVEEDTERSRNSMTLDANYLRRTNHSCRNLVLDPDRRMKHSLLQGNLFPRSLLRNLSLRLFDSSCLLLLLLDPCLPLPTDGSRMNRDRRTERTEDSKLRRTRIPLSTEVKSSQDPGQTTCRRDLLSRGHNLLYRLESDLSLKQTKEG